MPDTPKLIKLDAQRIIGLSRVMSFADDKTSLLWQSFMPRRREIEHTKNVDFISLQLYPEKFMSSGFNVHLLFEKWAAVAVSENAVPPEGMKELTIPEGMYAIFDHQGPANEFQRTTNYIYNKWLPDSDFILDNRPHYEVLPDGYNPRDDDATEQVFIPIKKPGGAS